MKQLKSQVWWEIRSPVYDRVKWDVRNRQWNEIWNLVKARVDHFTGVNVKDQVWAQITETNRWN